MEVASSTEMLKIVLFLKCVYVNRALFGSGPQSEEFMENALMITYWKLDWVTIERWERFSGGIFFSAETLCHLLTFLQGEVEYYQMYEGLVVEESTIDRFCRRCEELYRTTMANDHSAVISGTVPRDRADEDPARAARIAAARGAARTAAAVSAPDPAEAAAAAAANVEHELPPLLARFAKMFSDKMRYVVTKKQSRPF